MKNKKYLDCIIGFILGFGVGGAIFDHWIMAFAGGTVGAMIAYPWIL